MSNNDTEACPTTRGSSALHVLSWVVLVTASGAVLGQLVVLVLLKKCGGALPRPVKILFSIATLGWTARSAAFVALSAYNLKLIKNREAVVPIGFGTCVVLETFYLNSSSVGYFSVLLISVERLWVTRRHVKLSSASSTSSYVPGGSTSSTSWYGSVGSVISLSVPIIIFALFIHLNDARTPQSCYCYTNVVWKRSFVIGHASSVIVVQAISCAVHLIVLWQNKKLLLDFVLNKARQNLHQRFVVWSNIKTTRWLLPITLMHSLISCIGLAVSNIGRVYYTQGFTADYLVFICSNYLIFSAEVFIMPFMTIWYHSHMLETVKELLSKRKVKCLHQGNKVYVLKLPENVPVGGQIKPNSETNSSIVVTPTKEMMRHAGKVQNLDGKKVIVNYKLPPENFTNMLLDTWNRMEAAAENKS